MRTQVAKATNGFQTKIKAQPGGLTVHHPRIELLATSDCWEPTSWPIQLTDVTPLQWWRTMPVDHIGEGPQVLLRQTLDKIRLAKDRRWLSAMRDAPAAIAIAVGSMPIKQIDLDVDLTMSVLMLHALDGEAGAILALAHILYRTPLDHPFGCDLSLSWLAFNLSSAQDFRRDRFVHVRPEPEMLHPKTERVA
jgi:hypothetical protein